MRLKNSRKKLVMSHFFWKTALALFAICQTTQAWQLMCYVGNLTNFKSVAYTNAEELITSGYFNVTKKSVMYAHGYRGNVTTQGTDKILDAYLRLFDMNVCAIVYPDEANIGLVPFLNFPLVVKAAYKVQEQVAEALNILYQNGMNPDLMHMMGHSLGAHVSGNAARTFSKLTNRKIGRATGLEPAKPLYEGTYSVNPRIDQTSANFVDVIHTDTDRYGIAAPVGHVNFYPNIIEYKDTMVQPGCEPVDPLKNAPLTPKDACSHRRSVDLYIDSLTDECQLLAAQAADEATWASDDFEPQVVTCIGETTNQSLRGNFYMITAEQPPYGLGEDGLTEQ